MDPIMVGAGVARLERHGTLQGSQNLRRPDARTAVGVPQLPRIGVHQPFGEHCLDIGIAWKARGNAAHCLDIGFEQRSAIGRIDGLRPGEALADRSDQRTLDRRRVTGIRFAFCTASQPTRARDLAMVGML